jgi:hypothetical protein
MSAVGRSWGPELVPDSGSSGQEGQPPQTTTKSRITHLPGRASAILQVEPPSTQPVCACRRAGKLSPAFPTGASVTAVTAAQAFARENDGRRAMRLPPVDSIGAARKRQGTARDGNDAGEIDGADRVSVANGGRRRAVAAGRPVLRPIRSGQLVLGRRSAREPAASACAVCHAATGRRNPVLGPAGTTPETQRQPCASSYRGIKAGRALLR